MKSNIGMLYRSFQRALLYNIPAGVRTISFEQKDSGDLEIWVNTATELDADARQYIYSATGEIEGDFSEINYTEVKFFVATEEIDSLKNLKHLVFAMAE
jgi:adenylate cyclase